MTRMGARPDDCSMSLTTKGMVDHTYYGARQKWRAKEQGVYKGRSAREGGQ